MKALAYRIVALGLALLLCTGAATAQAADDVIYSMAEKLLRQLDIGSGFQGVLTITSEAVEGRENEALTTIMPIVMDVGYIQVPGTDTVPAESRLTLLMNGGETSQDVAEFSLRDGAVYMQSALLDGGWYLLNSDLLEPVMAAVGIQGGLPAISDLGQVPGLMSGLFSFVSGMADSLISANTLGLDAASQAYLTEIDFWLEGFREATGTTTLDDGSSAMEIAYRLPPDAVKAQMKQLLTELMNDENMLKILSVMMPAEDVALYLDPSLQPYYFYAIDGFPLEDDLVVRRVMSIRGDTVELQITMPLYDSVSGAATLSYTNKAGGDSQPDENTLTLENQGGYLELNYHTHQATANFTEYQGTLLSKSTQEDGTVQPMYWAAFDLSWETRTTKDLKGYTTQYQTVKLSVAPAEIPQDQDASAYAVFAKTELTLDAKFSSLATTTTPTKADLKLTLESDDMAQKVALALSGATVAKWTPEPFDTAQAEDLAQLSSDALQSLLSQAVVKGGLMFLPYLSLPKLTVSQGN
ncbi:MAG TPA: hypothetical protein PKU80_05825 [Candidatus Limiplasma sp.]|nr:hypothetical protein [Candidatus Limiplasma sp.]HRX09199.1 hypothetical protein [Candidatus Limiplasma sp.]